MEIKIRITDGGKVSAETLRLAMARLDEMVMEEAHDQAERLRRAYGLPPATASPAVDYAGSATHPISPAEAEWLQETGSVVDIIPHID